MRHKISLAILLGGILALPAVGQSVAPEVLEYVRAIRVQRGRISYTVDVTISASIPSLSKSGILQAVKKQDPGAHPEYQPVSFDGDKMIKTDVIARYLQAELEAHRPEESLGTEISPLNYKFIPKGHNKLGGKEALIYEVKPLRHSSGLFHGTVWLDPATRLPLMEEGKLEKLPSFWIKEVTFTRVYQIVDGVAVPSNIHSQVKVRVIGKSFINVEFSNYRIQSAPAVATLTDGDRH